MLGSYWTNFAKSSNPNDPGVPSRPVYNPKDEYLMNFGDTFRLGRFNSAGADLIAAAQEARNVTRTGGSALVGRTSRHASYLISPATFRPKSESRPSTRW
jgi:hypothetical protein